MGVTGAFGLSCRSSSLMVAFIRSLPPERAILTVSEPTELRLSRVGQRRKTRVKSDRQPLGSKLYVMRGNAGMPGNAWRGLFASNNPETGPNRQLWLGILLGAAVFGGLILLVFLPTQSLSTYRSRDIAEPLGHPRLLFLEPFCHLDGMWARSVIDGGISCSRCVSGS